MTDLTFQALAVLALLATVASLMLDELGARGLPAPLLEARIQMKERAIAASRSRPILGVLRIGMVLGYLSSLVALVCFVPYSPWAYLFFSAAWTGLAVLDAPQVLSRPQVPAYEASLLLNGAVLALCFLTPMANRFVLSSAA
jgi:hypothetical protein